MRIVAGKNRGTKLVAPENGNTRPTADRTRESLFGVLEGGRLGDILTNALVMDIFAGTGALGLEAISRGASEAVFIESDREAVSALRGNIARLKVSNATTIIEGSILSLHRFAPRQASLVLMDPPYNSGLAIPALDQLHKYGWIGGKTLIVVECDKSEQLDIPDWLEMLDNRRYGKARINFLHPSEPDDLD
jgi:16S rRNA (guanine966-N2)-methyltransferase